MTATDGAGVHGLSAVLAAKQMAARQDCYLGGLLRAQLAPLHFEFSVASRLQRL